MVRGSSAFVLVAADGERAARMQADYERFRSLMIGWDAGETTMLLRAYMQNLNLGVNR